MIFSFTPFVAQMGIQYWFLAGAPARRCATRRRSRRRMTWLVATGDFTTHGGMDRANYAVASWLAQRQRDVHLVAHRVAADDLEAARGVTVHAVPRPFGAHLAGAPTAGPGRVARDPPDACPTDTRVLMNGGNGVTGMPTWVHYLHAAYAPDVAVSLRTRISATAGRRYYLAREAAALAGSAPLVICNSRDNGGGGAARHYGVAATKTRVIYYGIDAAAFTPVDEGNSAPGGGRSGVGHRRRSRRGHLRRRARRSPQGLRRALRGRGDPCRPRGGWDADLLVVGAGVEQARWASRAATAGLTGACACSASAPTFRTPTGRRRRAGSSGPLRGLRARRA